ncbi:MAG: sugar ABC transporter permease [Spirochaetaceae bacterium]|nr:sugar ABC transporter permease [Spirochaetaceae bacterium]
MSDALARPARASRPRGVSHAKESFAAYVFLLPALCFFSVFVVYPMLRGMYLSFFKLAGRRMTFVGLKNYVDLANDPVFWRSLGNTLLLVVGNVPIVIVFSLFVAATIFRKRPFTRSLLRGVFYLPAVSSVVSITVVWSWIYHPRYGVLNYLISRAGAEPVAWLGDPRFALAAVLVVMTTLSVGQPIILYVASLGNSPESYVEAAEIDGASPWQRFRHIVWPLLMPTTLYIVIITTINSFQVFAIIQLLTSGGPAYATTTLMYQIYERAFQIGDFGQSSALGVILAVIIVAISVVQYRYFKSDVEY